MWSHMGCGTEDWIDGEGVVHCACAQRNIFDLRFECASNQEAAQFLNYLDLRKTLCSITMSLDGVEDAEVDALEEWIQALTAKIKTEARNRKLPNK